MKISRKSKTLRKHYICHVQGEYDNRNDRNKKSENLHFFMHVVYSFPSTHPPTLQYIIHSLSSTYMNSPTNDLRLQVRTCQKTLIETRFKYLGNKANLWHF